MLLTFNQSHLKSPVALVECDSGMMVVMMRDFMQDLLVVVLIHSDCVTTMGLNILFTL